MRLCDWFAARIFQAHRLTIPLLRRILAVLFAVIGRMTFTLACVSACLYSAGSQVLSLDRTIGGRMFGGAVFVGCMLSSGILGGGIVSRQPNPAQHTHCPAPTQH